jgi:hypothetical protein
MLSRLPRRFSIRMMLVLVTCFAVGMYGIHEHLRLRTARHQFWRVWSRWEAGAITTEAAIAASEKLMEEEATSPWISRQYAKGSHALRLFHVLAVVECPFREEVFEEERARERHDILDRALKLNSD